MRVLITGSRYWGGDPDFGGSPDQEDRMRAVFAAVKRKVGDKPVVIVHGAARGADRMAARLSREFGWAQEAHPADWGTYGKRAGFLRNQELVDAGADLCLAFPLLGSRGTYDCMNRARAEGIPVRVVPWK